MSGHGTRVRTLVLLVIGIAGGLAFASRARAQISPGPLAKAHADLEGASSCARCHGLRREPMSQLCLACHRDVQWLITQNRGLHAQAAPTTKKECASCHPDHAGTGFALIAWTEGSASRFDHRRAGWALEGKHAAAKCERCHTDGFRVSPSAALSKRRTGAGWMGLETACASCHRDDDVHRNTLGAKCESCHDSRNWKPAPKFDHERSSYPLTGKHVDVACDKCHLAPRLGVRPNGKGERMPQFKPVPFRECSSCHQDPHKGRLSTNCGECHVTSGFSVIERKGFDHALTRYALEGKHRAVTCEGCHGANLANRNPAFATCASCHTDAHRGEATLGGKPADCGSCHRVAGFAPSTFTVVQHRSTSFTLTGRHQQVRCAACHTAFPAGPAERGRAAKSVRLHPPFARCADCHSAAHGTQLAFRADRGTCDACHTDMGWKPSTFALASHASLRLALEGRHAAIACVACHGISRPGLPPVTGADALGSAHVLLAVPERECASCHVDPHAGRYAAGGIRPMPNGCATCHGVRSFRPSTLSIATHATFSYALDGAHRATPCVACHAEMRFPAATSTLVRSAKRVVPLPFTARRAATCQSCHENPHGPQFGTRKDGGTCSGCHGVDAFAPASRFDHEREAAFSLKGAHARVACGSCHRAALSSGGPARVQYRGLSAKCESCHANGPRERNR